MNKRRVVLDTNILISGLLFNSSTAQIVFDIVTEQEIFLLSEITYAEISNVFIRPKFEKYISLEKRLAFIASLKRKAEMIAITEVIKDCRDPQDNKFLELAVSGRADLIITGDQDLLILNPFRNIEIITITEFLVRFTES